MLTESRTGTRAAVASATLGSATDKTLGLFDATDLCAFGLGATFDVCVLIENFSAQAKSQG